MNTNGKVLSVETRETLFRAAQKMALSKQRRQKIKTAGCKGFVSTDWKYGSMGTLSGLQFTAEVVVESGETVITYLVRSFDLEEEYVGGGWGQTSLEVAEQVELASSQNQRPPRNRLN